MFLSSSSNKYDKQVPSTSLAKLLGLAGYEPTKEEMMHLHGKVLESTLSFADFKRLEREHRLSVQRAMKDHHGFTPNELGKHRLYFAEHEDDGAIDSAAMRDLIAKVFPDSGWNRDRHAKLRKFIKEADQDGNGVFDFEEYLELMARITDEEDRELLVRGLEIKRELQYNLHEMKIFRDVFCLCDTDGSDDIDVQEVLKVFANIVPVSPEAARQLKTMFSKYGGGHDGLDFWSFTLLMRDIRDTNWNSVGHFFM